MTTQASEQAATATTWMAAASGARYVTEEQTHAAAQELSKLPGDGAARASRLLNELAATEPTAAGLRAAGAKLEAALPGFITAGPRPPGQDPSQRRLTRAALMIFHGRVHLIATKIAAQKDSAAAAVELLRTIQAVRPALHGANIGIELEEEARVGLGHTLYEAAARALTPDTGPPR